jgi:arabinoxylan arabinofuranohydrolase
MRARIFSTVLVVMAAVFLSSPAVASAKAGATPAVKTPPFAAYLFTYFTGNGAGEEQIHFALSADGFHYFALNGNRPVLSSSQISSSGGVRDPHLLRSENGKMFYMVATDMHVAKNGWGPNYAVVLMKSADLIHWSTQVVNMATRFPEFAAVDRVWAPQTIYDPAAGKYMMYLSMRLKGDYDRIYYTYINDDFTDLVTTPKQLFYNPTGKSCIDADIIYDKGTYHMFFKTEGEGAGIKKAMSTKINEGYVLHDQYLDQTDEAVEGSAVFKLNGSDDWILMYDVYAKGAYQFTRSKNLLNFSVIDNAVSMDFHPRHGTVIPLTLEEYNALLAAWYAPVKAFMQPMNADIRKNNTVVEDSAHVTLSVRPGAGLSKLDPQFNFPKGLKVTPLAPQDFSKGPVTYTVSQGKKQQTRVAVKAVAYANPVLPGYYADPDIIYSEKEGKYYLYATSDGFHGWSGTYFKAFSSPDLVTWKDEGVILDLKRDVPWGRRNAWAPTMAERKADGGYKYYYYFTAAQKIGVALADHPAGPFKDSGKPLIDFKPNGVTGGQEIDPAVFHDPQSGKYYLYWGNGYMAGVALNDDMVSFDKEAVQRLTPDATFREGTYVIYRQGKYYFFWSEDDTRSPDYKVRYGTSNSPLGPIHIPDNNIVIRRNDRAGILATGHNSVIQVPGKDEWYIVYHRFTHPQGAAMGGQAGFHREVCIDRMMFSEDGRIVEVVPTL